MVDNNNTFDHSVYAFQESEIFLPRPLRFWLLLLIDIPSVYCSLIVLFYLLIDKTLRSQLINHIIIILLIIGLVLQLIDIPFHLSFLHSGFVHPSTHWICLVWWFLSLGFYNGCTIIMAWGSIHRYLLIYHDRMFSNSNKRFLFHYLPLVFLTLYILIFYIIVIVFPPCNNIFNYTLPVCSDFPCYLNDPVLGIWDSVVNNILPTMIITIFSLMLLIRVYWQKRLLNQRNLWRKQRKMTIQLVSTCSLYLIANIPLNTLIFAHLCGLPEDVGVEAQLYFDFLCYFVILLYPFVCIGSLSELRKKISWKRLLLLQRTQQNTVVRPQ